MAPRTDGRLRKKLAPTPILFLLLSLAASPRSPGGDGGALEIASPHQTFVIRRDSPVPIAWRNHLGGTELDLSGGSELELDLGDGPETARTIALRPAGCDVEGPGSALLRFDDGGGTLAAKVTYRMDPDGRVLRKGVEVTNTGREPVRLLSVVLGRYPARLPADGGERGFPIYLDGQFFLSLAHPAGFSERAGNEILLRHYPGIALTPGASFSCMEAVYGVARRGEARAAFIDHIRGRMRRVLRGHDRPLAIFESCGGQPGGDIWVTEEYLLDNLARLDAARRSGGLRFDYYCMEFWHDPEGDLRTFHRRYFPEGFGKVRDEILRQGMKPGLWIDGGGLPEWSIGKNPDVRSCFTRDDGTGEFCRAAEPLRTLYSRGFLHHLRENRVGLLKFDNLGPAFQPPCCENRTHGHLTGPLYSVEAIHRSVIEFLGELDAASPDVFIMLYWGHRSPWWLLHADTYFECGVRIEAASPSEFPAPHARDSVIQRMDQAQRRILDTPWLGKDSLGIWLASWSYNSYIGKNRWQEALAMDLARGSLLGQIWNCPEFLEPTELAQLRDFLEILRSGGDAFRHSRTILGDPSIPGPYGYACSDGRRAFLAIHNACLEDRVVTILPGPEYGLPDEGEWDLHRWHPRAARLRRGGKGPTSLALRPHEVVLLEAAPAGSTPALDRALPDEAPAASFEEPTRILPLARTDPEEPSPWIPLRPVEARAREATLTIGEDGSIAASGKNVDGEVYTIIAELDPGGLGAVLLEALPDPALPGGGPGRAGNGDFMLAEVRLGIAGGDRGDLALSVLSARADLPGGGRKGGPIEVVHDGDVSTGWTIAPETGLARAAIFDLASSVRVLAGSRLSISLVHGTRNRGLGKFRLSRTAGILASLPASSPGPRCYAARLPASRTGGLLLLTGLRNLREPRWSLGGAPLAVESVWTTRPSWPCSWIAWRARVGPFPEEVPLTLVVESAGGDPPPEARFLPY